MGGILFLEPGKAWNENAYLIAGFRNSGLPSWKSIRGTADTLSEKAVVLGRNI